MKRYQAIAFLLSTAMTVSSAVPTFAAASDINGHWAQTTIEAWQNQGRIGGYEDGTFRPDQPITRAEFVRLLNSAVSTQGSAPISFSDVSPSDWFYNDVAKAVGNNIASGFEDNTFRPGETVTRMQAAVFISNAMNLTSNESGANGFTDAAQLPSWAKGAVGAVVAGGYMSGYPDGSFGGSKGMTRAEAVSTLDRVLKSVGATEVPSDTTPPTTPTQTPEDTSKEGNMVWQSGGKSSGGKSNSNNNANNNVAVTGITLDQTTLELKEGQSATLSATITPENATDKTVTWSSSDETIATVSSTGTVSAVKEGSATITVTTKDGNKTATCTVTVTKDTETVAVTSVSLDKTSLTLEKDQTAVLTATVAPDNATDKTVTWSSSEETVATVSSDGTVTAIGAGEATITVTTKDGNKTATCTVTVTKDTETVAVTSVSLDKTSLTLEKDQTAVLTATVAPDNATDKTVTWSSSEETVATVSSDGTVTAIGAGEATITVTTKDGNKTATCTVTVTDSSSKPNELPEELKGAENVQQPKEDMKYDRYNNVTLSTSIPTDGGKEVIVNLGGTAPAGKFVSDDTVFAQQINGDYTFVLKGEITEDNSVFTDNTTNNPAFVDGKPNYMVWVVDIPVPDNFNEDQAKVSITQTNPALTAFYFNETQRSYTPDAPPSDNELVSKVPGCSDIKLVPTADGTAYIAQKAGSATGSAVVDRATTLTDGTKVIRYSMLVISGENITLDTKWMSADSSATQTVTYNIQNSLTLKDETANNHGFAQSLTAEGITATANYEQSNNTYTISLSGKEVKTGLLSTDGLEETEKTAVEAINADFESSTVLKDGEQNLFLATIDIPIPTGAKGVYMEQKNDAIALAWPSVESENGANATWKLDSPDGEGFNYVKKKFYTLNATDTTFRMSFIVNPTDTKGVSMTFAFSKADHADSSIAKDTTVDQAVNTTNKIDTSVIYKIDAQNVTVAAKPIVNSGQSTSGTTATSTAEGNKTVITVSSGGNVDGGVANAGSASDTVNTVYAADSVNEKLTNSIEGKSSIVQTLEIPVNSSAVAAAFADQNGEVAVLAAESPVTVKISGSSALAAAKGVESTEEISLDITPENGTVTVPVFVAENDTVTVKVSEAEYQVKLEGVTINTPSVATSDRNIKGITATAEVVTPGEEYIISVSGEATGGELTEESSGLEKTVVDELNEAFRGTSDSDPNWEIFKTGTYAPGAIILTLDLPVDVSDATNLTIKQTNEVLTDYTSDPRISGNVKTNSLTLADIAQEGLLGGKDGLSFLLHPDHEITVELSYDSSKTVKYTIKADGLTVNPANTVSEMAKLQANTLSLEDQKMIEEETTKIQEDNADESNTSVISDENNSQPSDSSVDTKDDSESTNSPVAGQNNGDATNSPTIEQDSNVSADPSATDQDNDDVTEHSAADQNSGDTTEHSATDQDNSNSSSISTPEENQL